MIDSGETFRAGVGIVVQRSDGRVLALERSDVPGAWQLPQGGLSRGEDSEQAAWRELREETGLTSEDVYLAASSEAWFGYELPEAFRSPKTGRGQVHRWFLFTLRFEAVTAPLPSTGRVEFRSARWMTFDELLDVTASFRRHEYRLVKQWIAIGA